MELSNIELLLRIFVAHFLSDFVFQPTSWAQKKDSKGLKSTAFWYHISVTLGVLAIMLGDFHLWPVFLLVGTGHIITDAVKPLIRQNTIWLFLADQFFHLLIITIVWLGFTDQFRIFWLQLSEMATLHKNWWMILFYILLSMPASVAIGKMTQKWNDELENESTLTGNKGLKDAGKWIGILERVLVFTFIVINQFSAIGFLIAAKSVFRFGDLSKSSDHKKTEYIIIGTLLSFSCAIAAGLIFKMIII